MLHPQGVPLRLEVGPKDLEKGTILSVRRDNAVKASLPAADITTAIPKLLEQIQQDMFNKAKAEVDGRRIVVEKWEDLVPVLDKKNTAILPWCEEPACEEDIKDRSNKESLAASKMEDDDRAPSSGAKTLCIPFDQSRWPSIEGKSCPGCGKKAKRWTMFGRSTSSERYWSLAARADPSGALGRLLSEQSIRGQKGGRAALLYETTGSLHPAQVALVGSRCLNPGSRQMTGSHAKGRFCGAFSAKDVINLVTSRPLDALLFLDNALRRGSHLSQLLGNKQAVERRGGDGHRGCYGLLAERGLLCSGH